MSELRIRVAGPRDQRAVLALERACFDEPWSEAAVRSELSAAGRRYSLALLGRQAVGCLGLLVAAGDAAVTTLSAMPEHRRSGIATRLLLDGIDAAVAEGADRLSLEVAASNRAAQALYGRFGLAPVGLRRGYYAGGEDAIVMLLEELGSGAELERRSAIAASLGSMP